jgi:hypothetical protein
MYLEKPQMDFITEVKQKIRHIMLLKISSHWLEKLAGANIFLFPNLADMSAKTIKQYIE